MSPAAPPAPNTPAPDVVSADAIEPSDADLAAQTLARKDTTRLEAPGLVDSILGYVTIKLLLVISSDIMEVDIEYWFNISKPT